MSDTMTVTPYIMARDARGLLEFLRTVLDAQVVRTSDKADGTLGHSEIRIGDTLLMIADVGAEWPEAPGAFYVYVDDADVSFRRALQAGATSIMEPADQEYGDRHGGVKDRWGNQWWVATPVNQEQPTR
jgi:PhnB protein